MKNYQAALKFALEQTYDLSTDGRTLRRTLDPHGNAVEGAFGVKVTPIDGYEMLRRMDLAHKRIKEMESALATHRRMFAAAMERAEQEAAESIGEDPQ